MGDAEGVDAMDDRGDTPTVGATEWSLMLVLSVLWGGSFFFYKVLVAQVPPFTVVLGRVALAALLLHLLLFVRRDPMPRDPALWGRFIAGSIAALAQALLPQIQEARAAGKTWADIANDLSTDKPLNVSAVRIAFKRALKRQEEAVRPPSQQVRRSKKAAAFGTPVGDAVSLRPAASTPAARDSNGERAEKESDLFSAIMAPMMDPRDTRRAAGDHAVGEG